MDEKKQGVRGTGNCQLSIVNCQLKKALFPGTFDPFTVGHASIVRRGLSLVDEIIIGIGINEHEQKRTRFSLEESATLVCRRTARAGCILQHLDRRFRPRGGRTVHPARHPLRP